MREGPIVHVDFSAGRIDIQGLNGHVLAQDIGRGRSVDNILQHIYDDRRLWAAQAPQAVKE